MPDQPLPLLEANVNHAYHYAPLHYLPFILRSSDLRSKARLRLDGYAARHFRSTSARQDEVRGFGSYVHTSLAPHPPILQAKLGRGFPHFEVSVPAAAIEAQEYLLCRFNIAKTRYFRGAKQEPPESQVNGRYFEDLRLPVARTTQEKRALLRENLGFRMIEVLVRDRLPLPRDSVVTVFSDDDFAIAQEVSGKLSAPFAIAIDRSLQYPQKTRTREEVLKALNHAVAEESWKGSGLEFDRV